MAKRQLFRHVLSDKIFKVNDEKNKLNRGLLANEAKPSQHIVQIRGNEPIIDESKWSKVFTLKNEQMHHQRSPSKIFNTDHTFINELLALNDSTNDSTNEDMNDSTIDSVNDSTDEDMNDSVNDSVNDLIDASEKSDNESFRALTVTKDIFNALVNGFDRSINIHCTSTTSVKEEVSILPIITALNACINDDDITQQDVENALEHIYERSTLTVNARNRWYEVYFRVKSKSSNHPGALFTILKTHNPQYYEESIKPLITKQFRETSPSDFEN